ncbi:MAG: hydrogenase/urease maturation nickel metallochaperone HypA [Thermoplasmata archaeon]|nr:hydrogenase/urease maturation nickel metallochaperone HypA [Thermoplasmata archaeon]
MHEEALLRDMVRKLEEVAGAHGVRRVRGFTVWIGGLSHVTEEAFRARFPIAARGTAAEGATIRVQRSADVANPRAQGVVLVSVEVESDDEFRAPLASRVEDP